MKNPALSSGVLRGQFTGLLRGRESVVESPNPFADGRFRNVNIERGFHNLPPRPRFMFFSPHVENPMLTRLAVFVSFFGPRRLPISHVRPPIGKKKSDHILILTQATFFDHSPTVPLPKFMRSVQPFGDCTFHRAVECFVLCSTRLWKLG
jgi:hypothetical protein